jgi:hypothetical protein
MSNTYALRNTVSCVKQWLVYEHTKDLSVRYLKKPLAKYYRIMRGWDDYLQRRPYGEIQDEYIRSLVTSLTTEGYAYLSLPQDKLSALKATCLERLECTSEEQMEPQEGKQFYLGLHTINDYCPSSIFVDFCLDESILRPVAAYLGGAPYLESVELIYSKPVDDNILLYKTQLWHRDVIDNRIIKLFIYMTEVTEENGPLSFLPRRLSRNVPWYVEHYLSDEVISKYVLLSEQIIVTGGPGTAVMVDTRNLFHCGSRCEKPRLTFVAHYNTGFAYDPRNLTHRQWHDVARSRSDLSPLQRLAIGLPT